MNDDPDLPATGVRPDSAKSSATSFKPFRALGQVATAIARTAGSAIALVEDAELRKKASEIVIGQANRGFNTVKQGVAHGAETVGQRIQAGPRQVQAVLGSLHKRIDEQRLANLLRDSRDAPVDIQIGPQLYEGAHQELRRRLWVALLDNASLSHSLTHSALSQTGSDAMGSVQSPGRTSFRGQSALEQLIDDPLGSTSAAGSPRASATQPQGAPKQVESMPQNSALEEADQSSTASPSTTDDAIANLAAIRVSSASEHQNTPHQELDAASPAAPAPISPRLTGYSWASRKAQSRNGHTEVFRVQNPMSGAACDSQSRQSSSEESGEASAQQTEGGAAAGPTEPLFAAGGHQPIVATGAPDRPVGGNNMRQDSESHDAASPTTDATSLHFQYPPVPPPPTLRPASAEIGPGRSQRSGDDEAWEMIQEGSGVIGFDNSGLGPGALRLHPSSAVQLSPEDVAVWQKLMIAISTVPPASTEYAEDSRYNTLLQISIGQEETDDIIARDINRTFPEHPQFGFEQGQRALFRVLKAYSLHDLEVQYCQGMGFVAGVLLMYLPEEPAFRMLMRLLDERGPNLRRLYLPALEGLKHQLRCLDWLLERHSPRLAAHLQDNKVTPVLYASQWFLTLFACPFPSAFSARIIDIILFKGHSEILLQTALAVVAECEADLLEMSDFEDILTYLKVEPVQWKQARLRRVLNTAVASVVTTEMIRAADYAVTSGYCGSLARRTASRQDLTTGSQPGGSISREPSVAPAAVTISQAADADSATADVQWPSALLGTAGDADAAPPAPVLGADDCELVLAAEMLRAPSEGRLTRSNSRLDPIVEQSSSQTRTDSDKLKTGDLK